MTTLGTPQKASRYNVLLETACNFFNQENMHHSLESLPQQALSSRPNSALKRKQAVVSFVATLVLFTRGSFSLQPV